MVAAATAFSTVNEMSDQLTPPSFGPDTDEPTPAVEPTAYDRWIARMERPLLVTSVLFVVVLVLPILVTQLPKPVDTAMVVANVAIWALFAFDYVMRLRLSADRMRFVRTHVLDLVVVLVPFFRPLRLLRLLAVAGRLGQRSSGAFVADVTKMVCYATAFTAFLGGVLALDAERDAKGTTIASFPDALWWAFATMTAVPYGDVYPVTQEGRLISSVLMILGLVFVGLLTAAIAAWMVQYLSREGDGEIDAAVELKAVRERLAAMEALLLQLAPPVAVPQQRPPAPRRRPRREPLD